MDERPIKYLILARAEERCGPDRGHRRRVPRPVASERTYSRWGDYLEGFFSLHADFVRQLGIGEDRMQATLAFIRACPSVAEGRFLHGDVSIRNVAIFGGVAEESLLVAQLVQAVLQAEHRQDRLRHSQADTVDVDVTCEFIRSAVQRAAA